MIAMTRAIDEPIVIREMAGGRYPRRFYWRGRDFEVAETGGVWRLLGRWWEGDDERSFLRVVTSTGVCLDLCHYRSTDQWYVHEVYD